MCFLCVRRNKTLCYVTVCRCVISRVAYVFVSTPRRISSERVVHVDTGRWHGEINDAVYAKAAAISNSTAEPSHISCVPSFAALPPLVLHCYATQFVRVSSRWDKHLIRGSTPQVVSYARWELTSLSRVTSMLLINASPMLAVHCFEESLPPRCVSNGEAAQQ